MTEQELQHARDQLWRVNGHPIRTLEESGDFLNSLGFCSMYPVRSLALVPSFLGAYAGAAADLPDAKHAFADARNQPATELMVRLLRERLAYETNPLPESSLLISAEIFPYVYALCGDRNPKAPPKTKAQGEKLSPLALKVYETIQKSGPISKNQLQAAISRELTGPAMDKSLNELWSILRITRVDYRENEGAFWDLLYRWSPDAVMEGTRISVSEAVSALLGKYLEAVVAAPRDDVEMFLSYLTSRSRVRDALNALLASREISMTTVGSKAMIQLTPVVEARQRRSHG